MSANNVDTKKEFTQIDNAILTTKCLSISEKLIYIMLKKHCYGTKNTCFPSTNTLAEESGLCRKSVQTIVKSLAKKGFISIQKRKNGSTYTSNLYTLYGIPKEQKKEEKKLLASAAGEPIDTSKGSNEYTNVSIDMNSLSIDEYKDTKVESQDVKDIDIKTLKEDLDYESIICDVGDSKIVDIIFSILGDTLNSEKTSFRIDGEDRKSDVVKENLRSIQRTDITRVIRTYKKIPKKVKNPRAYLLSMLFHAREDGYLDSLNKEKKGLSYNDFSQRHYSDEQYTELERKLANLH